MAMQAAKRANVSIWPSAEGVGGRISLLDFLNGVELCILPLLGFPGQSSPEFTVLSLGVPSWPHPYRCVLSHGSASTVLRVPSVSYSGVSHSVSPTAFVA